MPIYAMMNGSSVSNIISADSKEATEKMLRCVLIELDLPTEISIGWQLIDGTWIQPLETKTVNNNDNI